MSARSSGNELAGRRGRGTSAGIDTRDIVEVARGLEADMLTMNAVARELGVDRSAVNYHVKNRETLLELVAREEFAANFRGFRIPAEVDWQSACALYARRFKDALIATGSLVAYFRYDLEGGLDLLTPAEQLLQKMLDAGFSVETAGRSSLLLANVAMSLARDQLAEAAQGEHPQPRVLRSALHAAGADEFPAIRATLTPSTDAYGDLQFEHSMTVLIAGFEHLLRRTLCAECPS